MAPARLIAQRLKPVDAEDYRALMLEAYAQHPEAFTSTVAEREVLPLSWWQERVSEAADAPGLVLGLRRQDQLIGVVGVSFHARPKTQHKAKLYGVYVKRDQRGRGNAQRLIEAALDEARKRDGIRIVQLSVTGDNRAGRELYGKMGFAEYGEEPLAIAVDGRYLSKVLMAREL